MSARADDLPFDLRSLSIFLAACDAGGMAAAARRLGLTQPAVSLAVADLEARLNAALFDRSVRPLALTAAGALLRQRASALLSEARQIAPVMREAGRRRFPLVRVGLVDSLSRALAAPLAAHLAGRAEEVSVFSGLTAAHASALVTRNLDMMIGVDDLGDMPGLERWPIVAESYMLATPKGTAPVETVADLERLSAELRFARYSARSSTGVDIDRHLRRLGLELPRSLEFDTPHGVTAMVANGGHFAITTPLCLFEAAHDLSGIDFAPTPGPQLRRQLTLVAYRHQLGRLPAEVADVMRDTLRAEIIPEIESAAPALAAAISTP
ncbi:LysR family transcriptional regulator [Hansschlegelia plantiphila]|uniref:LysR family transcriptional regulator n=1 Tax=Hansschlegelia plantiphila TaxID=374655 RepID=A0A9W6IZJ6_9HYPH|nr:LysR family transcriptional regulator [Hansschlegelia plantiphila]GLK66554.1 LysR family transcriptional regulator [Hansschlegelia plantiphila]